MSEIPEHIHYTTGEYRSDNCFLIIDSCIFVRYNFAALL